LTAVRHDVAGRASQRIMRRDNKMRCDTLQTVSSRSIAIQPLPEGESWQSFKHYHGLSYRLRFSFLFYHALFRI
jgi:hypothetical protein